MAVEPRRGCGYRKVGGLYVIGGKLNAPCCKMPIPLKVCPTCSGGIKQNRGWTWIDPRPWTVGACRDPEMAPSCVLAEPNRLGERVGLLWIGTRFYPSPEHFLREARTLGISRRLAAIPRGIEVGQSWVFLAHPHAIHGDDGWTAAVFSIFKATALEKLVTESQARDADAMAKLEKQGVTPVVVPDDDPDHQGTVYDDEAEEAVLPLDLGGEALDMGSER